MSYPSLDNPWNMDDLVNLAAQMIAQERLMDAYVHGYLSEAGTHPEPMVHYITIDHDLLNNFYEDPQLTKDMPPHEY